MKYFNFILTLLIFIYACSKRSSDLVQEINQFRDKRSITLTEGERAPLTIDETKLLKYFPPNNAYRCNCSFYKFKTAKVIDLPTYAGTTTAYKPFGKVNCKLLSDSITLTVFQLVPSTTNYTDKLFLPFKDETNGVESYGGGRYIDLSQKAIQNDQLIVDFNKAYNPLCAYKSGYRCPIPPPENYLKVEILAGEKAFHP